MKSLEFIGTSLSDLSDFPVDVRRLAEDTQGRYRDRQSALPADTGQAMKERVTKSSGNVFVDLGYPPEEAAVLAMRAEIMAKLRNLIDDHGWTQQEASKRLGIAQSRVSDLVRGKWDKFSLDMLVTLAARVGQRPSIVLNAA